MKHGIKCSYWEKTVNTPVNWFIDKAAKLGFDGVELETRMVMEKNADQLAEMKAYAADQGILLTLGSGPPKHLNLCSTVEAIRKDAIDFRLRLIEKAYLAGIKTIGGGLHTYWPVDFNDPVDKPGDWARGVSGMQILAKTAADYGICLCVEVMNRFENHILNTAAEGVAFCRDVGSSNVKLLLDTFHMNIEEDSIPAAIRLAGPMLGHLHTGEGNRKVPGKGHLPWREICDALADIEYKGVEVMEPFVRSDGAAARSIHVWRMLVDGGEEQMDRDATGALQMLRTLHNNALESRREQSWQR
jgi:D-psicose/D-tagatose/L-ribulose 3-epimerase